MKQVKARELYARMMRTLAQTGNGWMTFKDSCNMKSNQTGEDGHVVHSSNLCTEIIEVTSQGETAVCNLGSVNLSHFVKDGKMDYEAIQETVRVAVKYLDRVVDINFYPTPEAEASNNEWRPVGLGLMGLQDVFFLMNLPFDSDEAREILPVFRRKSFTRHSILRVGWRRSSARIITFPKTKAAKGVLSFDTWGVDTNRPRALGSTSSAHYEARTS